MQIVNIGVSELVPYAHNTKKHPAQQIANVANSIKRFGWQQPIVVDENNVVVIGHCRLMAAKLLGLEEVPVTVASGLTEDEIRELRIADNKTNESDWDFAELEGELLDLEMTGFDFDWDDTPVEDTHKDGAKLGEVGDDDEYNAEPKKETGVVRGQVYQLGDHRLMCGDSTDMDDVSVLVGGCKADLLLTDPPYNVAYTGKTEDALTIENDDMSDEDFREFLLKAFRCAYESMRPGAAFYIWHADSAGKVFRETAEEAGLVIRQCLIWAKNTMVLGRQDYQWKHEPCLYGWKDGAAHTWESDRKQTTVLAFDKPARNEYHPTMKPIPLFAYQLQNSTKPGDVVLDLFGGSGTTMMACEQTGRKAYLMELDPVYAQVIIDRWEIYTGKKAVLVHG